MARVKRVIRVSVGFAGVPKRHPFRLRGVVLAPLNACQQGVTTRDCVSFACRIFPDHFFLLLSSPPTISPKNGAINIVVTLSCGVFLVRLRGVDTWPLKEHSIGVPKRSPLEGLGMYI